MTLQPVGTITLDHLKTPVSIIAIREDSQQLGSFLIASESGGHTAYYTPNGERYPDTWSMGEVVRHAVRHA